MPEGPVLIVGASRGIGAELVRQYRAAGRPVVATVRKPDPALFPDGPDLLVRQFDVRDVDGAVSLARSVADYEFGVVIHNAGIFRGYPRSEIMEVNTAAPLRVAEALIDAEAIRPRGALVLMSSQLGSRRGRTGSLGDYGDSKAALNDGLRERAEEWRTRNVIAIVMHPGWVRTDMGGPGATLSVEESVSGVREVISGLGPADHGRFLAWDGRELPW